MANEQALTPQPRTTLIPNSWFRAQSLQRTLGYIDHKFARKAPLGPGERLLGSFILPPFQRPPVWSRAQQVRFIESCWMGLPLGVYVVNMGGYESPYDLWLLDGQQRVTAILEYMTDAFSVYGHLFSELTVVDRRMWDMSRTFTCLETRLENEAELREVYDRLAYGGTAHEHRSEHSSTH